MHDFAAPLELFPNAELAVLPGTTHMQVIRRTDALLALVEPFLAERGERRRPLTSIG